jgi:hypothetical protein
MPDPDKVQLLFGPAALADSPFVAQDQCRRQPIPSTRWRGV